MICFIEGKHQAMINVDRSLTIVFAGVFLLSCGSQTQPFEVISPSDGAVLRSPWTPMMLRMPESYVGGHVSVSLDGVDVTDPLGLVRGRSKHLDGGADYLGQPAVPRHCRLTQAHI